jgi:two-component system nitrogen regulation response regulator NtrX
VELKKVLLVEDEIPTLENLKLLLELDGFVVDTATDLKTALQKLGKHRYPLLILDLRLPDGDGMEVLHRIDPSKSKVIVLTAHGSIKTAVEAVKIGAYDFLQKPVSYKELKKILFKALESLKSVSNSQEEVLSKLLGTSEAVQKIKKLLPELANKENHILIRGEQGVGKTFVGTLIHELSPRRDYPLIRVPLGGKNEFELERELFGSYIPGKEREGVFEKAQRGTVLLVGIEHLPLNLQKKLAQVLKEQTFTPLGESTPKRFNARIIATTSKNLYELAREGKFDEELLIQLGQEELEIPPLRERKEDIKPLFEHFIEEYAREKGVEKPIITEEVYEFLKNYDFPGNVQELRIIAERAVLLHAGKVVKVSDLNIAPQKQENDLYSIKSWREAKKRFEREFLKRKLIETGGNIKEVAKLINLDISNIYRKIKEYHLEEYLKK